MNPKTKIFLIVGILVIIIGGVFGFLLANKSTNQTQNMPTKIKFETSEGSFTLELYPDKAPITVANFLTYAKDGSYEGTVFHRVIADFMIQGGGYTPDGNEKETRNPIKLESNNGLKNDRGTIAMARTNVPDSATNQFFINTKDNAFLNYSPGNPGYAVFGKVIEGMDTIDKIEEKQTGIKFGMEDWPVKDVLITKVSIL